MLVTSFSNLLLKLATLSGFPVPGAAFFKHAIPVLFALPPEGGGAVFPHDLRVVPGWRAADRHYGQIISRPGNKVRKRPLYGTDEMNNTSS
jgi:hypothetical protein